MYSLAPRFTKDALQNLAPNTYFICTDRDTRENFYPFSSSKARKFVSGKQLYTHALYNPEETLQKRILGGASLLNRAPRLTSTKNDIPGPAAYDPRKPEKGCKYKPPPCHGTGRLYVCRVPYSIFDVGPSIPTHRDENGYDVDEDGNLVKALPDEYDQTRGPAYYHIRRGDFCFTTRRYHEGCQWSKSKSIRKTLDNKDTPGPGTYDPNFKLCPTNEKDEEYRQLARLFSFAPRFTEGEMLRTAREGKPGPAQYNINTSSFKSCKSLSINPRPFISAAERLSSNIYDSPGPGTYEICDCPTEHKQFSTKDVPFGFQSDRFRNKNGPQYPGPATYTIKGPIEEKLSGKFNKYASDVVAFGQKARRKIGFVSEEAGCLPGPQDYDIEDSEVKEQDVSASCFKSRTKRFRNLDTTEDAGPASYSISEQFNKNHNRTSHNTGMVPFLQSSQCRTPGSKTKTPGPGDYSFQEICRRNKGSTISAIARFPEPKNDIPGPGTYTLHPTVDLSIYKAIGTHNLRLKESVLRTKLKLSPAATRDSWCYKLKLRKKLRWFAKSTEEYEHCAGCI